MTDGKDPIDEAIAATDAPVTLEVPIYRIRVHLGNDQRRPAEVIFPQDWTMHERLFLIEFLASTKFDQTVAEITSPAARLRAAGLTLPGGSS